MAHTFLDLVRRSQLIEEDRLEKFLAELRDAHGGGLPEPHEKLAAALVEDLSTSFVADFLGGFAPQGPPFVDAFYNITFSASAEEEESLAAKLTLASSATILVPGFPPLQQIFT